MNPKEMLITPEETADAPEKKVAAKTEVELVSLQQHYESIDRFITEAENNPETAEDFGRKMGGDMGLLTKHLVKFSRFMRIVTAKALGKPLTSEEISRFQEEAPAYEKIKETLIKCVHRLYATPEGREKFAEKIRSTSGHFSAEDVEATLRDLEIVGTPLPNGKSSADAGSDNKTETEPV